MHHHSKHISRIVFAYFCLIATSLATWAQSGPLHTPAEYGFAAEVSPILGNVAYNQEEPYNNLCPILPTTGKHGYTGCAATAMAQIMQLAGQRSGFPATGTTTSWCSYTSKYTLRGVTYTTPINNDISAHTYDWGHMRETYDGVTYTDQEAEAIAQLMYDCGTAVQMQYTNLSSDAIHWNIAQGLIHNFGYDGTHMQIWKRANTSQEQWERMVYGELSSGRPIIISGYTELGAGHVYVIDGYDTTGRVHVKFGYGYVGDYYSLYEHNIYVCNFEIITGIQPSQGASTASAKANVHRYLDMVGNYPEAGLVYYRLTNDGLGETVANGSRHAVNTCLGVVRGGQLVGLCPTANNATRDTLAVDLTIKDANSFCFSTANILPLRTGSGTGTITYPDLSGTTLSPADFSVQGLGSDASGILEGDILVPLLSTDYGYNWSVADGNESNIQSLRVCSASIEDGYYRIYSDKRPDKGNLAITAGANATELSTSSVEEIDDRLYDSQIFEIKANSSNGYLIRSFMADKYLTGATGGGVSVTLTANEAEGASYIIESDGNGYYTLASGPANENYLYADQDNKVDGWRSDETGYHLWRLEKAEPRPLASTQYAIVYDGCPFGQGINRWIEYKDEQTTGSTLTIKDNALTADQLKANSKEGYVKRIWVRNNDDTHEIHVTYNLLDLVTRAASPFSSGTSTGTETGTGTGTGTGTNTGTGTTTSTNDYTPYNIYVKGQGYLYNDNGTARVSPTVSLDSDDAQWVIVYTQSSGDGYPHYELANKGSKNMLYANSTTDGTSFSLGNPTGSNKLQRYFFLAPSLESGYWVVNNRSEASTTFVSASGSSALVKNSAEALWGEGGSETFATQQADGTYGYDAAKIAFVRYEASTKPTEKPDEGQGDVNGDGNVNLEDLVALIPMLRKSTTAVTTQNDINGDGKLSLDDVLTLVDILLGK